MPRQKRRLPIGKEVQLRPKRQAVESIQTTATSLIVSSCIDNVSPCVDWIMDPDDLLCKEVMNKPCRGWFRREGLEEKTCVAKTPILEISYKRKTLPLREAPPPLWRWTGPDEQMCNGPILAPTKPPIRYFPMTDKNTIVPTSELEELCVAQEVPAFESLPRPWTANVAIDVNGVTLFVAAFCSRRRLSLCVSLSNILYCLDADEIFRANYVIHRTFVPFQKVLPRPCDSCNCVGDLIYPYQLSIQPLASVVT
jgi:hypothetical protein